MKLIPDLSILGSHIQEVNSNFDHILSWFKDRLMTVASFFLLYRGSEHGFTAKDFHLRAGDSSPPATITFIKSEYGKVFGGFTQLPWQNKEYRDYADETSFIFSITHKTSHSQYQNKLHSVRQHPTYLPTFGYAHDIYICDQCDKEAESHSLFGHSRNGTFRLPEGLEPDS